ncbi:MAG: ammonium transporter [Gammaproteobacteria bacterium]|nr:ammonium transporter [Gammaproteobacteria bacterium]
MRYLVLVLVLLLFLPVAAVADEVVMNGADTAWILTSTALVLFMTLPGLALFYGGLVRSKNVLSVLMQCFAIAGIASVIWLIAGYSLAFDAGNGFIGGLGKMMLAGVPREAIADGTAIPEVLFMLFQMTFAVITPALIVGGFAERMKFSSMLLFSCLWLLIVYVPVTHWVWGGGWLGAMGLYDFAGGTVVHITAGVAAIVAAVVLKPRRGFPRTAMPPHNMTMTVTGAGMLWVGWFGFNGGSALTADGSAAMAMLVTHISAAMGIITWSAIEWKRYGKPSVLGAVTGMVAGLGTITPASGFVGPGGALIIGLLAGGVCFTATQYIKRVLKIDDSLDVFPVHGVGGILGTMLAGVFASTELGVFSGYGFNTDAGITSMGGQLTVQAVGVVATLTFTVVATFLILKVVSLITSGLRVSDEDEVEGLDICSHEEQGYIL